MTYAVFATNRTNEAAEFSVLFGIGLSQKSPISMLSAVWRTRQDSNL